MRIGIVAATCALWLAASPASAQTTGTAEDHDALRRLKNETIAAINARDYAKAKDLLYPQFMATVVTQDSFTDFGKLKDFYEGLYTRPVLRMKTVALAADADELSQIHEGTFAITRGPTREHYELADGRTFDLDGRWTAVSIKDNGAWKILAVHTGVSFLDNPVMAAVEHSVTWFASIVGVCGLLLGFAGGWFAKRARKAA